MLSWLARKLKHRLTPETLLADERLTVVQLSEALAKHPDFTGFAAWRAKAGEAAEEWLWVSKGLDDKELLYQLEKAATSAVVRMRG